MTIPVRKHLEHNLTPSDLRLTFILKNHTPITFPVKSPRRY